MALDLMCLGTGSKAIAEMVNGVSVNGDKFQN